MIFKLAHKIEKNSLALVFSIVVVSGISPVGTFTCEKVAMPVIRK